MDRITRLYSQLTKTHFIGIGVVFLVSTAVCVGVLVTHYRVNSSSSLSPSFQHFKEKLAEIDHGVQWKRYNTNNVSLENAFLGGRDKHDGPIYVCRVHLSDEIIPGSYIPDSKKCRFMFGESTYNRDEFELLTTKDSSALIWLTNLNNKIFSGAMVVGSTFTGLELCVARTEIFGLYQSIGHIQTSDGIAYVPEDEDDYNTSTSYEVLCLKDFAL